MAGYRFGAVLIGFFVSSSALTRYGSARKAELEDGYRKGGQRNWIQVLSNSAPATLAALGYLYYSLPDGHEALFDFTHSRIPSMLLAFFLG